MENSKSLTQAIVQDLGVAIVRGVYDAENPFPIEADLCTQYNVSRSVLREAVKMLTSKGLLSARPRQGTWVQPERNWNLLDPSVLHWLLERKFSIDLLIEFTEIRLSIEPQAASYAASRATTEGLVGIREALERMDSAALGEDDPLQSDIAFHVAILEASGNRFFAQMKDFIETALRISIRFTNKFKGVKLADADDHRKVFLAIQKGDVEGARKTMESLLSEAMALLRKEQASRQKAGLKQA